MRKENAVFRTAFLSEEGSQLRNRDYFAFVELDDFACYVAADSLDEETEKNSAQIVVECILREFMEHPSLSSVSIKRNLLKAHRELLANTGGLRLRASVSMAVTNYVAFRYASAGNSRFCLLRNGRFLYQSRDQSLTENLVEEEVIPKDKAARHEERNNLYSYLGQSRKKPKLQISKKRKLANGDILALYTRGVWENCSEKEFLGAAKEVSTPQDVADNVEEQILGKRKTELDNYTIAVTFADKVYLNPQKKWTLKKVLAIVLPIVIMLLILGIGLFVRYKIRAGKREEMQEHLESAMQYVSCDNYEKASGEYRQAKELAKGLKDKEKQEEIDSVLCVAEQILLADGTLSDGEYEKAQEQYLSAKEFSQRAGGVGYSYIGQQLQKTDDYMELFELLESGEAKEDYGDYAGAAELYQKAKKKASDLYDREMKKEALEKQRAAQETLEDLRQESLRELEEGIQKAIEEEQVAQELENQSLMNDKKNALELESKGNDLMKTEDYQSAITYFETAAGMYETLGMTQRCETLQAQIASCKKLDEEAKKKAAEQEAQKAAEQAEQDAQSAAAKEAQAAAEEARQAALDLKDAQKDKAVEDALKAAEEAQKAAEEAKKAAEESKNQGAEADNGGNGSGENGNSGSGEGGNGSSGESGGSEGGISGNDAGTG